jgi:CheY-like chemotaxis protein
MRSKNVFLADDDEDDRHLFKKAFSEVCSEHHLSVFDSNVEMLTELQKSEGIRPDLVFIDLNMPGVNGMDCLREIREMPQLNEAPVAIYSTVVANTFIDEVRHLGASYFIKKPYDFYQLAHLIKYVIDKDGKTTDAPVPIEEFVLTYDNIKKKPL